LTGFLGDASQRYLAAHTGRNETSHLIKPKAQSRLNRVDYYYAKRLSFED